MDPPRPLSLAVSEKGTPGEFKDCNNTSVTGYCVCIYIDYQTMYEQSIKNPDKFWAQQAEKFLHWMKMYDKVQEPVKDESTVKWFTGGQLNVTGMYVHVYIDW